MKKISLISAIVMLTLLSLSVIGAAFGRYYSKISGSAGSRVAVFSVKTGEPVLEAPDNVIDCNVSGDYAAYKMSVKNDSEVDTAFSVEVTGVPAAVSYTVQADKTALKANGDSTDIYIRFTPASPQTQYESFQMKDIKVKIKAEQTQL